MTHSDMTPELRDHIRDLHFMAHQTLGIGKLTDAHRAKLDASYRAALTGISEQWRPTPGDMEPPF